MNHVMMRLFGTADVPPRALHVRSPLDRGAEVHAVHGFLGLLHGLDGDRLQPAVDELFVVTALAVVLHRELVPHGQLRAGAPGELAVPVGVFQAFAAVHEGQSCRVRAVDVADLPQRVHVAFAGGHLLAVELQEPVGTHALWPVLLREDGRVVEDRECEMVLHQVLAAVAQVERVPVLELLLHGVEQILADAGLLRHIVAVAEAEEHVVEELVGELLRLYPVLLRVLHVFGNGVVGHVDGRV
jgi:hypothetical protein